MKKRAQQTMGMPFSMIFSILLVVFFIVFAFIAVRSFLDIGKASGVGLFYTELQDAVENAWQSQSSQDQFVINLPKEIKMVCFANLSERAKGAPDEYAQIEFFDIYEANTFLIPPGAAQGLEYKNIKYLDISTITQDKNPYCVGIENDLLIKKEFYNKFVIIE